MENRISFFLEDTDFKLYKKNSYRKWLQSLIDIHNGQLHQVNYIFCSDEYLHELNLSFLSHDTLTDIITFPYEPFPNITADIFISVDRIRENAAELGIAFKNELVRVMSHGILHLCGYGDKTAEEKAIMRDKENEALMLFGIK
jgi:probable rRNA maturation factor